MRDAGWAKTPVLDGGVLVHPKIIINPQRRGLPSHIGRGHVSQVAKKPRCTGTVARQGRRAVMPHHPLPIAPRGFQKNIGVTQGIGDLNAGFESRFAKQGGGLLHAGSRFRVGFQGGKTDFRTEPDLVANAAVALQQVEGFIAH